MKRIFFICLIYSGVLFAQGRVLTLQDALEIGLKNSKELRISKSKLTSADARVTEAASQLLPQLKFTASYMRLSNVPPFEVQIQPFMTQPYIISNTILDNYNLKLSLQQPLFTGLRLLSLRSAAKENYRAEESSYSSSLNDAELNIENTFWNYYKAQQLKSVLQDNLRQVKNHLDDTKNFLKNGLATQNDVLKLEVEYSNIELQAIEADNNIDVARLNLNRIIGLPLETSTEIKVDGIDTSFTKYNIDDILKEAENKRNDLKALQSRVNASNNAITAANAGWFPSIFLVGDYYYSKPNSRYFPAVNEFKDTWDVGVTLQWDLWNWGYTSSKVTEAEQDRVQAQTAFEQLNDAIGVEVYQAYLTYKRSMDKIEVSKQAVKQAEENYNIIQNKYNQQVATSTDLIDAEVSVRQARTNLTNALVDYQLTKVKLEKAIGRKIY
jgi:outer membrane protein TolC